MYLKMMKCQHNTKNQYCRALVPVILPCNTDEIGKSNLRRKMLLRTSKSSKSSIQVDKK